MAPHAAVPSNAAAAAAGAPPSLPTLTPAELESLQAQEVEVLSSILGDDFSVASTRTAWKAAAGVAGQEYNLVLRPEEENLKPHLSVVMRLRLPKRYPLITPIFSLEPTSVDARTQGISDAQRKTLEGLLGKRARELLGAEMIWELVEVAQEWITRNNQVKLEGDEPVRSLEEERDERAREQELASRALADAESIRKAQEEAERARKLAALIEEQSALRSAAVAEEKNRKKAEAAAVAAAEHARSPGVQEQTSWLEVPSAAPAALDVQRFLDPIEWQGGVVHAVRVGPVLSSTKICCVHLANPLEEGGASHSAPAPWALEKFRVDSAHYELVSGRRELETIEWELDRLRTARHPSLLNVVASALVFLDSEYEPTTPITPTGNRSQRPRQVLVLREPSRGPTAAQVLEHAAGLPWSKVRSHMHSLLEATQALHAQNLLHRGICLDHVHLEPASANLDVPSAKLGAAGYMRRLQDMDLVHPLCESSSSCKVSSSLPPSWEAPESRDAPASYSRKRDVWDLAVTVLQVLLGAHVVSAYATPDEALASQEAQGLPPHVLTLLASMLERATKRRPLVVDVLTRLNDVIAYEDSARSGSATEAPRGAMAIPGKSSRKLSAAQELAVSPPGKLPMDSQDGFLAKPGSFWQLRHASNSSRAPGGFSRYENDFVELELLGKGAYGAVFKAQNRLDGRHYAIKKIKLSSSVENDDRTLREITALSRLNHTHIVRYVTCWIQEDEMASDQLTSSSSGAITSTASKSLPQSSDEDFQVGFRDDDFLSMGHDAFSKGADIHFGDDDDDDSESDSDEDSDETASESGSRSSSDGGGLLATRALTPTGTPSSMREPSRRSRRTTQQSDADLRNSEPPKPRWLYVQMELVENQTLRETIDKGLSIDEAWRLFRQVLEALVHIHSLGIIHRDLKPSNILIETSGNIKIGDFGLATTAQMAAAAESAAPFGTGDNESGSTADLTSNLGTNLYIAPEVLNVRKGSSSIRYGTSVDLYAAGIIFFEMLAAQRVYKTGMERVAVLRELRGEDVCLPGGWPEAQLVDQTKIIRWLLNHDPSKRPAPLELLKSDLMPAKLEDEVLAECMRLMANPASVYNHKMLSSLFERDEPEDLRWARDFTFDAGTEDSAGQDHRLVAVVTDHLRSIFHRHGAIELGAPLLVPPNGIYGSERRPVQMLDKTGRVVELPFDLVVPFARLAARADTRRLKRFNIAPVYRQNLVAGGQPRSVLEVDFDIVSPERTTAAEGEVLALVDEILQSTPGLNAEDFVVLLSHSDITNMVLQRVPTKHHATAISAFAAFSSKASAASGRAKLLELALPRSVIDEIEAFNLSDDIVTVHARLERLVAVDLKPKLARAVDELAEIIQSAQSFGAHCRFLFTPLLVSNSVYRGGCHFQVVRSGKRRDVLASGGRYDTLVRQLANPTATLPPPHAVGVQLAVGRIALAVARYQELNAARLLGKGSEEERSFGLWTPRRCDVYVAANGPGLLNVRMDVCRELWAAGISADLAYEHAVAEPTELLAATCRSEGILFLVSVRSEHSASCKVRSIIHNEATEVRRHELASWLSDQIARQRTVDVASSSTPMPGTRGAPVDASRGSAPSAPAHQLMGATSNVNLLMPERQSTSTKKAERHRDERRSRTTTPAIGKAAKYVAKLAEESASLPIFAVDFEGASFERLCAALVFGKDDFAWKALLESLGGQEEKDYARLVREHVAQVGRAWLYSIREDRAALVQC